MVTLRPAEKPEGGMMTNPVLRAAPGDRLVVQAHHQGEPERDGEILEVHGEDGAPPYLVRWEDGETTMLYPSSDVSVQHFPAAP
jgi:hypothetical protein